ncbi:STAS domain-containing protein [Ectothiorhodospiraceae bacterium 2226]|nr:STAS domain-containing protein [Ectothiorhodospiraceae bacterium 2226]
MSYMQRVFPFLRWFPLRKEHLRTDLMAGITVALVLIPQSMAYAQLAGLPAYYGLYASFIPVLVGALWGSSNQLATGPVAVVSLLTASALIPLAAEGTEEFIALAILLALMVGVTQLLLGVFKLGVIVSFLSHPVIVGFTNAAAIIIGLSQLNKLLGVQMGTSDYFFLNILAVFQQIAAAHWPSLLMGLLAFAIMISLKKYVPKVPGVLMAVVVTTVLSWAIGFERTGSVPVAAVADADVQALVDEVRGVQGRIAELQASLGAAPAADERGRAEGDPAAQRRALLEQELADAEAALVGHERALRGQRLQRAEGPDGEPLLYRYGEVPAHLDAEAVRWRVRAVDGDQLVLVGGGEVVGAIPSGLPSLQAPSLTWDKISTLLASAVVIALVGFMEAISIAKAMAAKTKQRLDPNQELVGQGLANITGSLSQSFPVSGSFSRSAVNLNAGAKSGMAAVFTAVVVLITLLFLTPLLYHLPQAVLAAIIMMAVVGLINFGAIKHAWQANKHDGIAAVVTFLATLSFAPHLDMGILAGAGLAIVLYLFRTMKPRVAILGRHPDGTLRDARIHDLPTSEHIIAVRFDGSLYFANVPHFEDAILEAVAANPKAEYVLVVGDGINEVDASGEDTIHNLVRRLRDNGITMVFSGLKWQVMQVMHRTGLYEEIGAENFFRTEDAALDTVYGCIGDESFDAKFCPLKRQNVTSKRRDRAERDAAAPQQGS